MENQLVKLPAEVEQLAQGVTVEKRPIMSYIILSVMMLLYLYAGLAEINWPLIPATILGFYLLIKIERDGRK